MKLQALGAAALAFALACARASGPVAPLGWNGSNEPSLPGGQDCCIPADLCGTGLVGGAFVLLSDSKTRFAVFALTYTYANGKSKERWHLLETHPVSQLPRYRVSVVQGPTGAPPKLQVCEAHTSCRLYAWGKHRRSFVNIRRTSE